MASNVALLFLVIIFFITSSDKIECKKNKNEKISFFLTNHEITKIISVPGRTSGPSKIFELDEVSFQFTAFENTFVVDLTVFYPREDSKVDYISKLSNGSGTYLDYKLMIYQGYVRNIKNSSVLGYFGKNCPFRGYVMTDEIFSIEPYDSGTVIVYRFKDVITPGCSKKSGDEGLDCSDTRYFVPWKANNPPALRMPSNYELLYDKYFKFYRQKEAKRAELKRENDEQKKESSTEKQHKCNHKNHKCDDENEEGKKVENKTETLKPNKNKKSNFESKTEHSDKTTTATSVEEMKNAKHKNVDKKEKYENGKENDLDVHYNKDKNNDKNKTLKDDVHYRFIIPERTVANEFKRKVKRYDNNDDLSDMKKESFEDTEILKKEVVKRGVKSRIGKSKVEALESDPIEAIQCNVQVMVAPSLMSKFDEDTEIIIKDVIIQFILLNKIFLKIPLQKGGKSIHFTFHPSTIEMFADEVYSPFSERADLEYFAKHQPKTANYCLSIGLANQYLLSGNFFDGYIPAGKGGICSKSGNVLLISHGNQRTPAPMALFFASLVRGVTRAMGANDMDEECYEGSFPNPLQVLQDYLLPQEIAPPSSYSIFSSCNVKEIEAALKSLDCFLKVSQPLCGNAILDPGEECDCGPIAKCAAIDPCCNPPKLYLESGEKIKKAKRGCTLSKNAKCSNHQECCEECEIVNFKKTCFSGPLACDIAECDGTSASCPTGAEASNGLICFTNSTLVEPMVCKDNACDQNLCSLFDLKPCTCAFGTKKECVYCCEKDGKCQAAGEDLQLFPNRTYFLPSRTECMGGTCQEGACTTMNGEKVIYNETVEDSPRPVLSLGAHSKFSILHIIMGTIFPLFVLFLLKL